MKTVWVYVDTSRDVGDADHLKVYATEVAAEEWLRENDPEGVAFEYPVEERDIRDTPAAVLTKIPSPSLITSAIARSAAR
jgi:hypothetical protein